MLGLASIQIYSANERDLIKNSMISAIQAVQML